MKESQNSIIMSYFDQLPIELKIHIGHYIPYKQPPSDFQIEYKIFCQDWKNQTQAKPWTGLDPNLSFTTEEIEFLNKTYFKHQKLKRFYQIDCSLENGLVWSRKPYSPKSRRNTI